jgi:23S rRNA (pseudouridine1915-N3)-methyltransferase
MRLAVAAVGRLKDGPERELAERYCKRAEQIGRRIGFRSVDIVEIRESRAQEVGKRVTEESIALANVIPDQAVTVLLDQRGDSLDSAALADRLRRWRDEGRPAAVFVIGGAEPRRPGRTAARVRPGDLAAPAGPGHAARTDLSRPDHAGRTSLPPRLTLLSPRRRIRSRRDDRPPILE